MYKVWFNDIPLHDYIDVLRVNKPIMPSRTNHTKATPTRTGETYTGYKYEPLPITLSCRIDSKSLEEQEETVRILADILNTSAPAKLIISNEPDKFYYAILDGEASREKNFKKANIEIPFICHDPIAYAIEDSYFEGIGDIIEVENGGTEEAFPVTTIGFNKKAQFVQLQKYNGEAILIGTRPNSDIGKIELPKKFHDPCEETTNFLPCDNVLDGTIDTQAPRVVDGAVGVNAGGYAIIANSYGENENAWHGPAVRRDLGVEFDEFELNIIICHNSKGDLKSNGAGAKPPLKSGTYYTASDTKIRISRSSSSVQKGMIPKNKKINVTEIEKNWCKVTYNSITGYISMGTLTTEKPKPATSPTGSYSVTTATYLREKAGSKYKSLIKVPAKAKITITEVKDGYGKATYSKKTGWIYLKYCKKVSTTKSRAAGSRTNNSCENQKGRVEVYGFDRNGQKLFKLVARDSQKYYEYTEPEVWINNEKVLSDKVNCPAPKKGKVEVDGKYVTKTIDSGRFGDWNELRGLFKLRRVNKNGKQTWYAEISKEQDGKVIKTIKTKLLTSTKFNTGKLNNIVVWFGQYKAEPPVEVMSVNSIKIEDISLKTVTPKDYDIFEAGDELTIDNSKDKIYLNGEEFMSELDVGSKFFSLPSGTSHIRVISDDETINSHCYISERWI